VLRRPGDGRGPVMMMVKKASRTPKQKTPPRV
jgi:hypothetical protein